MRGGRGCPGGEAFGRGGLGHQVFERGRPFRLAHAGKQVVIAGLDTDYLRRPFEPIPTLCGRAEFVTKMLAVCHRCGGPGLFTQRIVRSDDLVVLGAQGSYEARCRSCYDPEEAEQPALVLSEAD